MTQQVGVKNVANMGKYLLVYHYVSFSLVISEDIPEEMSVYGGERGKQLVLL